MARLPLAIHVSPDEELVTFNGEIIAHLTSFELDLKSHVQTTFRCVGCFPRLSGRRIQEPTQHLLRIYVGDDVNDTLVTCKGRPVSLLRDIQIRLSATQKRIIRFTSYIPFPEELKVMLLDLGVELIVAPPGDENANL